MDHSKIFDVYTSWVGVSKPKLIRPHTESVSIKISGKGDLLVSDWFGSQTHDDSFAVKIYRLHYNITVGDRSSPTGRGFSETKNRSFYQSI